jgi:hypothetical protein
MVGDILSSNVPMLQFMRSLGFSIKSTADGPEIRRVSKRLLPAAAETGSPGSASGAAAEPQPQS